MILNVLTILLLITITMLWGIRGKGRGLFSSLLTFVCVLIAGAVAFGVWEPVTYGLFLGWREDLAWGLGLALPFVVSLAILRVLTEMLVPSNVKVDDLSNFVGGALFGLGSAVITVGVLVLSLGSVNFGPNFLGYEPIDQTNGDLVHSNGLWVPVDKWTSKIYEHLSLHSFGSGDEALARRHPDVYEHVSMNRLVYNKEGNKGRTIARNGLQEGQASIAAMYTGDNLSEFLTSGTINAPRINIKDTEGEPFPAGSTMAGFVVEFDPGARETGGQVVIGPGQVRLVYTLPDGTGDAVHPHAIIADPEANAAGKVWFPRNTKELFVPSVGGESRSVMGFEFALPPNATPRDLIVKGLRLTVDVEALEPASFASAGQRDGAIVSGSLFSGGGRVDMASLDRSNAVQSTEGASTSNRLGNRIINITTGTPGSLKLNENKEIVSGRAEILNRDLNNRGLNRENRADQFDVGADTKMVQLTLADSGNVTPMGGVVQRTGLSGRPRLIDADGRAYDAVGYIYSDGVRTWIQYEPGAPLSSMNDVEDQLSPSKRDQTLILLFRPTQGVTIRGFAIGDTLVGDFTLQIR
ncbi:MAG: hypothetical protein Tsb0013_05820 [Phycisphaerales bacterium]